jgi:recyclin-1
MGFNLDPLQEYTDRLLGLIDGQTRIADQVFPSSSQAMILFVERILDNPLMDYVTTLIDCLRQGSETEMYLKAVVGTYHQLYRFVRYLNKPKDATTEFRETVFNHVDGLFAEHIEPYLRVELDYYKKRCDAVVDLWKKKVLRSCYDDV